MICEVSEIPALKEPGGLHGLPKVKALHTTATYDLGASPSPNLLNNAFRVPFTMI